MVLCKEIILICCMQNKLLNATIMHMDDVNKV